MTTRRLLTRRREFITALVCLDTALVVMVAQGRDRAEEAGLLAHHAPDAEVMACDLFSGYKSTADTIDGAVVIADVFHLVRLRAAGSGRGPPPTAADPRHRGKGDEPQSKLRRVLRVVLRVAQERLTPEAWRKALHRLRAADTDDEVNAAWQASTRLRSPPGRPRVPQRPPLPSRINAGPT